VNLPARARTSRLLTRFRVKELGPPYASLSKSQAAMSSVTPFPSPLVTLPDWQHSSRIRTSLAACSRVVWMPLQLTVSPLAPGASWFLWCVSRSEVVCRTTEAGVYLEKIKSFDLVSLPWPL